MGVIMDPIESIDPRKDSTLALLLEAQRRHPVGIVAIDPPGKLGKGAPLLLICGRDNANSR